MEPTPLQPTLLKDYAPPEFHIPKVELDISIEPNFTEVCTKLYVKKTNKARDTADLRLDGEQLELLQVKKNGTVINKNDYKVTEHS